MIRPGRIYPGTTVTLAIAFQSDNGAAQDVTSVLFKTSDPDGQTVTYIYGTDAEVVKIETGMYKANIKPAIPGRWYARWEADGEIGVEDTFIVQRSQFSEEGRRAYE